MDESRKLFVGPRLKRLRRECGCKLPLVFLIGDEKTAAEYTTPAGLRKVKEFADGIGPNKAAILKRPGLVADAHSLGMSVTVWTFRSQNPGRFADVRAEMAHFLRDLHVDAVFTDNPDRFPRD